MKIALANHDGIAVQIEIEDRLIKALPDQQQTWLKMVAQAKTHELMLHMTNDLNSCLGIGYREFLRNQRRDSLGNMEEK